MKHTTASKILLLFIGILMLLLNMAGMIFYDNLTDRWMRFLSMLVFFLFYLLRYNYKTKEIWVLSLFLLCDALLIFYENPLVKSFTYLSRISGYIVLMFIVLPYLKSIKIKSFQILVGIAVLILNIFLIGSMIDMVPEGLQYPIFKPLFFIYSLSLISLVIVALSYQNRYMNQGSITFMLAVIGLVTSDVSFYIAYYLDFSTFYYTDRLFNIFGILSLLWFFQLRSKFKLDKNPEDFRSIVIDEE